MNRIMGRYNADLRQEMSGLGLTTPKMRALAVLSVIDALPISELAVYAVVEQSTLSRALEQLRPMVWSDVTRSKRQPGHADCNHRSRPGRLSSSYGRPCPGLFADVHGIPDDERQAFVATLQKILKQHPKARFLMTGTAEHG
jgi:hypothetical protein